MSGGLFSMLVATMFATQAGPAQPAAPKSQPALPKSQLAAPKKTTPAVVAVTGCISPDTTTPGGYLFLDSSTGAKYRLSGFDERKDSGQRGEIVVGTGARRVTIRGGLVPSPNVAAQAGAIDPNKAVIARAGSGPNGTNVPLPEFRAERIQTIGAPCVAAP
ncbi:MAG: hypothetical protein ABI868_02270 [Acidobacteriota bacterium]